MKGTGTIIGQIRASVLWKPHSLFIGWQYHAIINSSGLGEADCLGLNAGPVTF